MSNRKKIRTYKANEKKLNFFSSFKLCWEEIYSSRHVVRHLFVRDFIAQFRQKILGYLWIILAPILGMIPFVFMNGAGILNPGKVNMPYPIYVFIGMGIWGILINSFSAVSSGLLGNSDLIMRTNIPKITFAITGLANVLYNFILHIAMLVVILLIYRLTPSPMALLYPFLILPVALLGIGLGLIFSVIGAVARDLTGIATTGLGVLMYFTPVIYGGDFDNSTLHDLMALNPLSYLVDTPRSVFFMGVFSRPIGFLNSLIFSLTVFAIGVHAFYMIKDSVAERL